MYFYFLVENCTILYNVIFVDSRMIDSSSKSPKGIEMNVKLLNESYDKKEFLTKIFVFKIGKNFCRYFWDGLRTFLVVKMSKAKAKHEMYHSIISQMLIFIYL